MNIKEKMVTGALTIMTVGAFALLPANADSIDGSVQTAAVTSGSALNSAETPQHLVWDMNYGPQALAQPDADESAGELAEDLVTDLSFG